MSLQKSYILFYKPYGVLSQFTSDSAHSTLRDFNFPKKVYSVGRLDADSEGLLLLTDDGKFKHALLDPKFGHARTYAVQVERIPDESALARLRKGIMIEGIKTKPAKVRLLKEEPAFPPRSKPIRFRANVPTCWLELILTEGRNRQVRKMTAAIGHPTLRLIRTNILFMSLEGLRPGEWRELRDEEVEKLKLEIKPKKSNRHKPNLQKSDVQIFNSYSTG
jgi:23S rRNA pseudouridine2457 synthase